MAHFAELDDSNKVLRVIVVNNKELLDAGLESEQKGIDFCQSLFGGRWIQTSYNGNIRKNYANVDFIYDPVRDAFIPPKPYESWTLNENTCQWDCPVPRPDDDFSYEWNEETLSWDKINE